MQTPDTERCPKCGAGWIYETDDGTTWECGSRNTGGAFRPSYGCLDRQLSAALSEIERLTNALGYLADCTAATAGYEGTLKSVPAGRKQRYARLAQIAADMLRGVWRPDHRPRPVADIIKHCESAASSILSPTPKENGCGRAEG